MSHQASDIITPKALLLDERLTPLERNAWLTFRSLASSDGTVVLSYDALRGYLPSAPGSKRAALETVSRAVLCLRLSTWIALVEYRRNPMTGFSMANRYVVRNQPLAFDEACLEDKGARPCQCDDSPTGTVHSRRSHASSEPVGKAARHDAGAGQALAAPWR